MSEAQRLHERAPPILPRWATAPLPESTHTIDSNLKPEAKFKDTTIEIEQAKSELGEVREILNRLRKWHDWEIRRRQSLRRFILSKVFPKRPPCPLHAELKRLATFFFPFRSLLKATVCDFGDGRFERTEITVSHLEPCTFESSKILL